MTIRDIAKAAGVSPATVSRILNHKDQGIREETRARVKEIIETSGYVPYSKIRDKLLSDTVAVMAPDLSQPFYSEFVQQVQGFLNAAGYSMLLYLTNYDAVEEERAFNAALERKISGLLMFPVKKNSVKLFNNFSRFPAVLLDSDNKRLPYSQIYRDFRQAAGSCTEFLLSHQYHRIALLLRQQECEFCTESIESGYRSALLKSGIEPDSHLILSAVSDCDVKNGIGTLVGIGADAMLCQDVGLAEDVYAFASGSALNIPSDLAVISMADDRRCLSALPAVNSVSFRAGAAARQASACLVSQMSKQEPEYIYAPIPYEFISRGSVGKKQIDEPPNIAVIGSMNMDIVLKIPHSPETADTVLATQMSRWPGGKGANQAVGVTRNGANAYMIGCLGNDFYGRQIYEQMTAENVRLDGVSFDPGLPTGTAYINVRPDGSSTIVVSTGANASLSPEYIDRQLKIITKCKLCLIQMEIPTETVLYIIESCRRKNIQVILKPSPAKFLDSAIMDGLYILSPNEKELETLVPGKGSVEDKARSLVDKGVQNVIVTLGDKGCLLANKEATKRYDAFGSFATDATGASDVFISCLAVFLSENKTIDEAIQAAVVSAGYSVMREGVQNSIAHRAELEDLLHKRLKLNPL